MTDKVIKKLELTLERLKDIDDKENSNKIEILLKELKNSKKSKKSKSKSKSKSKEKSKKSKSKKSKSKKSKSKKSKSKKSKGCSEKGKKIDITFNTDQIIKGGKKIIVTQHNGGYYYYVDISNKSINVYAKSGSTNDSKKNYDIHFNKHVLCTNYKDVFIGDDKKTKNSYGSTILINTKDNEYVYICDKIVKFTTKNKIIKYHSPIGNNFVPYPYALDKEGKTYLIYYEKKNKSIVPVLKGKYKDAWSDYYGHTDNDVEIVDNLKVKIINEIKDTK